MSKLCCSFGGCVPYFVEQYSLSAFLSIKLSTAIVEVQNPYFSLSMNCLYFWVSLKYKYTKKYEQSKFELKTKFEKIREHELLLRSSKIMSGTQEHPFRNSYKTKPPTNKLKF